MNLPPARSAAVQIVRPPSPSSEKAKDKDKKPSPEKRDAPQRICRNVMIYGHCKYQDSGCIYYHPPPGVDPTASQNGSPVAKNASPSPAASKLLSKDKASGISAEHLAAPVFVPKFETSSPRLGTPVSAAAATSTPPAWPPLPSQGGLSGLPTFQPDSAPFTPQASLPVTQAPSSAGVTPNAMTYDESLSIIDPNAGLDQSGMYLHPRQPLDQHLFASTMPSLSSNPLHPAHPHAFFVDDEIRRTLQTRQEAVYVGANGGSAPGLPQELGVYHSLVPLPLTSKNPISSGQNPTSKVYGLSAPVYRATSEVDGSTYCLRRLEGYKLVSEMAFGAIDTWRRMRHPNIVGLREAFTTKGFGDNSLVVVYDYHPSATSLHDEYIATGMSSQDPTKRRGPIPERILWSYITQIANALKAIHSSGLAVRHLDASKVLLTGKNRVRLNGCGLWDVLAFDQQTPISVFQQEDLMQFGKLIVSLASDLFQPSMPQQSLPAAVDHISRQYSPDMRDLVLWLITKPPGSGSSGKTIDEVIKMMGPRILNELDAMQSYTDTLENELGSELSNGRIARLLTKLGFINERAEFELDPRWSDTGDRYILKLFRDYVFHSIGVDGKPILDLSHVLVCLNKLDAGLDERIMLVSRDDQSCLVVSYREIKHCIEAAFNELRSSNDPHRVHR
ncbi:hypothetical protein B9479_003875 [Cryptococcus floricola]|uniref:PAN2-PAN3 deadenylation complex subunit PAN3 n=1 Tax=Cryptococcus floricola TaxID=2591691 RepID=A0A5D3AVR3_9TREE|nr:hypothetical protein B9479_003875 [Cryptococcus floricola]